MSERVWAVGAETELPWSQLPFEVVSSDGAAAVLGTSARTPSRHVCAAVERLLRGHRAALSDPMTRPDDFRHARRQVDVLLPVAEPGTCATPETARELVVLRTLVDALHQLPSLGTDPFAALTSYDMERGGDLVDTLRVWLAAPGDPMRVAARLGIHVNTLRYRLRRISELCGVDLHRESPRRLELVVRLMAG